MEDYEALWMSGSSLLQYGPTTECDSQDGEIRYTIVQLPPPLDMFCLNLSFALCK